MAFVLGLAAAAARAVTSDRSNSNPGNGQNYNNNGYNNGYPNNNYNGNNAVPYVRGRGALGRMDRRAQRLQRTADDAETVMSLMSSGSRSRSAAPAYSQPANRGVSYMGYGEGPAPRGVSYMEYGEGPAPRGAYYSPEEQRAMAGSYRDRMPVGAPEGYRWRDEQSRDQPVSRRDGQRDMGSSSAPSYTDGLPSYEQVVQRPRKS